MENRVFTETPKPATVGHGNPRSDFSPETLNLLNVE
jgi:hypothetical protein